MVKNIKTVQKKNHIEIYDHHWAKPNLKAFIMDLVMVRYRLGSSFKLNLRAWK